MEYRAPVIFLSFEPKRPNEDDGPICPPIATRKNIYEGARDHLVIDAT